MYIYIYQIACYLCLVTEVIRDKIQQHETCRHQIRSHGSSVMIQPFDPKIAHLRWPFRFHIHQGGTNLLKKATTMQLGDEISRDWVLPLEVRWMNFIHFQKIGHEWLWIVDIQMHVYIYIYTLLFRQHSCIMRSLRTATASSSDSNSNSKNNNHHHEHDHYRDRDRNNDNRNPLTKPLLCFFLAISQVDGFHKAMIRTFPWFVIKDTQTLCLSVSIGPFGATDLHSHVKSTSVG